MQNLTRKKNWSHWQTLKMKGKCIFSSSVFIIINEVIIQRCKSIKDAQPFYNKIEFDIVNIVVRHLEGSANKKKFEFYFKSEFILIYSRLMDDNNEIYAKTEHWTRIVLITVLYSHSSRGKKGTTGYLTAIEIMEKYHFNWCQTRDRRREQKNEENYNISIWNGF